MKEFLLGFTQNGWLVTSVSKEGSKEKYKGVKLKLLQTRQFCHQCANVTKVWLLKGTTENKITLYIKVCFMLEVNSGCWQVANVSPGLEL